ncbi:MAG TPA: GGDEF domain-containing protein [Geobacteraceae bacterium]|nr:GGDEF domain-containing protein [Geobacteraceae bacterium]
MPWKNSLTNKITLRVLLMNLLLVVITACAFLTLFTNWYKKNIEEQQMVLVTRVAEELDDKIQSAHNALIKVSKQFDRSAVSDPGAADTALDMHSDLATFFDSGLFLFSPEGKIVAETAHRPSRRGFDLSHRTYIKNTLLTGKPYISEPFISSTSHKAVIMFTAPVFTPDGRLIAILGGSLDLRKDNFLGKLARAKIGRTGYFFLFNRYRTMIMHPNPSLIMNNDLATGVNQRFDLAIAGMNNSGETVDFRGNRTFQTFKQLRSVNWILATDHSLEEVYAPIRRATRFLILVIPLGGAFLTYIMWRIMRHLTEPIHSLIGQIRRLEKGEEARPVTIHSGDEFEELADAFNSLMGLVRKKEKELYHLSVHDTVTGLYNRTYFEAELARRAKGRKFPVSIIMADVDGLKQVNDTFGHHAGDRLMRAAAGVLRKAFRGEDVVARIGGDEFSILLGDTDQAGAEEAVLRVKRLTAQHNRDGSPNVLSLSMGTGTAYTNDALDKALMLADKRMYEEKAAKKGNRL